MRDLALALAHGIDLQCGQTHTGLQQHRDGWQLRLRRHDETTRTVSGYTAVLLTLPAPQLAPLLPAAATLDGSGIALADIVLSRLGEGAAGDRGRRVMWAGARVPVAASLRRWSGEP